MHRLLLRIYIPNLYYTKKVRKKQLLYLKNSDIFCGNRNLPQNNVLDGCCLGCFHAIGLHNYLCAGAVQIYHTPLKP